MCLAADVNLREIAAICEHFTGADLKALLYNAQLKVIHEHTDGDQVMNESVVWIKGDSNQCGARRASVVRNETGAIKMSLSKSFSENSSGGRSPLFLDQQSPRQIHRCAKHGSSQEMINVSGNSSIGRSPCAQHECDLNCTDGLGIVGKDNISITKGTCKNIFQYPDVDLTSGDKAKQHTSALLDGEKEFQVINSKLKRITSLTLAKSTSTPELLPSAQVKIMSAPATLDFPQKHYIQDIHTEHSSLGETASDGSKPELTEESQEAAESDLSSADVPAAIVKPLAVAQGEVIPYDDMEDDGADYVDGKATAECETNSFFSTPKQPRKTTVSSYRKRRSHERARIQGKFLFLICLLNMQMADCNTSVSNH